MSLSNEYVQLASARVVKGSVFDTGESVAIGKSMSLTGNQYPWATLTSRFAIVGSQYTNKFLLIGYELDGYVTAKTDQLSVYKVGDKTDFKQETEFKIEILTYIKARFSAYNAYKETNLSWAVNVYTGNIAFFNITSGEVSNWDARNFRFVCGDIAQDGTTTHHYVPVQNKNDGVIYIYDTITDTIGSVTGTPLEITPQVISSNPESRGYIFTDSPHPMNCGVTYEYGDISYQWQVSEDNTTFTNIQGATASSYTPTKILGSRYYKCVTTLSSYGKSEVRESSVATITFYKIDTDNLIYDRTQADIDRLYSLKSKVENATATAEEIAEWTSGMRGALNYTDMNRINEALYQAKNMCEVTSISVVYPYALKRDYVNSDTITSTTFTNLLANVTALKTALQTWILTPVPTGMKTITDVNAVEYILSQVEDIIKNIRSAFRYSGEMHSGEQY